jgi:hypothetical protein
MGADDIAGLCKRLRAYPDNYPRPFNPDGHEAADTLERQAAEIERLRRALDAKADEGMLVLETLAKMTPDRAHRHVREGLAIAREARAALTGEDTISVKLSD